MNATKSYGIYPRFYRYCFAIVMEVGGSALEMAFLQQRMLIYYFMLISIIILNCPLYKLCNKHKFVLLFVFFVVDVQRNDCTNVILEETPFTFYCSCS